MNKNHLPSPSAAVEALREIGVTHRTQTYYVTRVRRDASQDLDFYVVRDGRIVRVTWWFAGITDTPHDAAKGMRVTGGGMNLALHVWTQVCRRVFGAEPTSSPEEL